MEHPNEHTAKIG